MLHRDRKKKKKKKDFGLPKQLAQTPAKITRKTVLQDIALYLRKKKNKKLLV
jgi:hypothetical protein